MFDWIDTAMSLCVTPGDYIRTCLGVVMVIAGVIAIAIGVFVMLAKVFFGGTR
jgi:hypothetical protein